MKQDPGSDNMAWYGVRVPDHVSAGGLFRVLMKDRSPRKMIWVPVRCPEGASGGDKIQVCTNSESKLYESDNTSCETSLSSSYSSMESLPLEPYFPPTLPESNVPQSILPASLPPTLPESVVPESILPASLTPTLPDSVVHDSIVPESYDELIFDAVCCSTIKFDTKTYTTKFSVSTKTSFYRNRYRYYY